MPPPGLAQKSIPHRMLAYCFPSAFLIETLQEPDGRTATGQKLLGSQTTTPVEHPSTLPTPTEEAKAGESVLPH